VNQEENKQDEVDGMNNIKGADFTINENN